VLIFGARGRKARVTVMIDQTLRSNRSLALVISRSMRGMVYPAPALLTRCQVLNETHVVIDSSEIVSSWNPSIPAASTALSLFVLRAEAKTHQPAEWKAGTIVEHPSTTGPSDAS